MRLVLASPFRAPLVAGLIAAVCSAPAHAQAAGERRDSATRVAGWRVGPFVGAARNSPASSLLGTTPGRDHLFVGVQALTPVLRAGAVRIAYTAQLLPAVIVRGRTPPREHPGWPSATDGGARRLPALPARREPGGNVAYAFGVSPFGLDVAVPVARAVGVYAATAAGALAFTRPFPVPEARRVNFTLEFGGGLVVRAGRERWLQLGYKYHHLSNAYTAAENPGLDAHVLYAGYQWTARLPR